MGGALVSFGGALPPVASLLCLFFLLLPVPVGQREKEEGGTGGDLIVV